MTPDVEGAAPAKSSHHELHAQNASSVSHRRDTAPEPSA